MAKLSYKNIILGIELDNKIDNQLADKAVALAKKYNAKLYVVHAIEYVNSYSAAYGVAIGADIEQTLLEIATKQMHKFCTRHHIPMANQIISFGPAKSVVLQAAKDKKAELIVVGNRGRHGAGILFGSTAEAVTRNAPIDVYTVRVKD
jgi:universal stress protein A